MKNIFKFLGLAIIACSMMVACGEKENTEGNDTTPVNPPAPQQNYYKVTWMGNTWEPGATQWIDFTTDNYMTVYLWQSAEDQGAQQPSHGIMIRGWFIASNGTDTYDAEGNCVSHFYDPSFMWTADQDYADLGITSGTSYYRYQCYKQSFTETVTAIDLNAGTITATWDEDMFDIEQYAQNNGQSLGNLEHLSADIKNFHFTLTAASK